jgi:hypothetical protein
MSALSVPAQRVLCHDRRRDLLSANAAALTAVTSVAAAAARSHAAITSTAHPGSCATRDGATGGAGDGAGALVSNTLVAVPAGDEEHGRTIRHGTNNSSSCNSCAGRVDLAARAGITS